NTPPRQWRKGGALPRCRDTELGGYWVVASWVLISRHQLLIVDSGEGAYPESCSTRASAAGVSARRSTPSLTAICLFATLPLALPLALGLLVLLAAGLAFGAAACAGEAVLGAGTGAGAGAAALAASSSRRWTSAS